MGLKNIWEIYKKNKENWLQEQVTVETYLEKKNFENNHGKFFWKTEKY